MESILPSQPESYKPLIWRSLLLYRRGFSKVVLFSFLLAITTFIPRIMSDVIGQDLFTTLEPLSPYRLWLIVVDIAALIFFVALLWHMHCVMRNKHEPFIEDFTVGAKKSLYVFIAAIIQSAIVFAFSLIVYGLLFLLHHFQVLFINSLPGIIFTTAIFFGQFLLLMYVSTLFIFMIPLIAIENKGIFQAIETSVLLGWNHWWRIFSTQLTPWIFYIVLLIIVKYAFGVDIHIYFTKKVNFNIWATTLNIGLFTLFAPWVAALLVTQLKDLELRKKTCPKTTKKTQITTLHAS